MGLASVMHFLMWLLRAAPASFLSSADFSQAGLAMGLASAGLAIGAAAGAAADAAGLAIGAAAAWLAANEPVAAKARARAVIRCFMGAFPI